VGRSPNTETIGVLDAIDTAKETGKGWPIEVPREGYKIRQTCPNATWMSFDSDSRTNYEQWVLLTGDVHWDNPDCDRRLYKRHLDEAKERNAIVIDNGDFFCAMQGKYDKRSNKEKVRPEHQKGDYFDRLVQTAADYLAPYAENFALLGLGNHETSVANRHEIDLTARLSREISYRTGVVVPVGGYTNWVRFSFLRGGTNVTSKDMWMMHGYGGGGPVTKDMIQSNRQDAYVIADIMVTSHTHDSWSNDMPKIELCPRYATPKKKDRLYIKIPTYKDEYKQGAGGFHIETGKPPKPVGGQWLRFFMEAGKIKYQNIRAN
jgi:hypothetical protein